MDPSTLQSQHPVDGLTFDQNNGLTRCNIATPFASATIYLQGAHLTAWAPAGFGPAIFLSSKSEFAPGKPIRGGIPIVFPWFANDKKLDRIDGHPGPMHGFARIQDWTLARALKSGDETHLTFTLGPTALSRRLLYGDFELSLLFRIGPILSLELTVANIGVEPLHYEEAFHTYFQIGDIHEVSVTGLEPTPYIDKIDNFQLKPAANAPIAFTGPTDRIYQDTTADCHIADPAGGRAYTLHKTNSRNTVVWNPGKELPDIGPWDWHDMVCVETANIDANAITLEPGQTASMSARIAPTLTRK
jgi:glucose-6-phosphate 1-epimerase